MASSNPTLVLAESGLISALYGENATALQAEGQSQALGIEAGGSTAEAAQYGQAAQIAGSNAQISEVSGQLQEYQNTRTLMNTLGTQAADISGAGFGNSGSSLYLARSSMQQGLLQNQVIGMNAELQAGGYLEQAASSEAEQTAATTAAATETSQAGTASQLGTLAQSQATSTSQFINSLQGLTGVGVSGTGLGTKVSGLDTGGETELGGKMVSPSNPYII